ncbi:2800_t:CDS:2, partial [Racocetra fulgida]
MPLLSKRKRKARNRSRNVKGQYNGEDDVLDELSELYNRNDDDVSNRSKDLNVDDLDGWDDTKNIETVQEFNLVWKNDNQLEKIKRGLYMKGKTPKSTYYDKYGLNRTYTKAAVGTKKITSFFNNTKSNELEASSDLELCASSNSESEVDLYACKAKDLKKQLEQDHNKLIVKEYNYKRAIFEYLSLLSNNNGRGKIKASLEVAQKIFIDGGVWKARKIQYLTKYWLLNDKLPPSRHGKHQKTIRIIDDEDIKDKCHTWIRSQNFKVNLAGLKKFIEE